MNSLGLSMIMKMGCICSRETVHINGTRYSVLDNLGQGGFSTVDLVENSRNKNRYALKRIQCHSIEDQKIAQREIDYCRNLRHVNIIELVDWTIDGSADIIVNTVATAYLVLPYYKRGTLADELAMRSTHRKHYALRDILGMFLEVCKAVEYLHEYKPVPLAHRDIKTANVCFCDGDGYRVVLMDLGSLCEAQVSLCGQADGQRLQDWAAERCSMTYRAPELFQVESYGVVDQRTDVWSLGCLLYACGYFKSPYDVVYERGDSVALAVISGTIHFPKETPYIEEFHDLITFLLQVNPNERPFIDSVIERTQTLYNKLANIV